MSVLEHHDNPTDFLISQSQPHAGDSDINCPFGARPSLTMHGSHDSRAYLYAHTCIHGWTLTLVCLAQLNPTVCLSNCPVYTIDCIYVCVEHTVLLDSYTIRMNNRTLGHETQPRHLATYRMYVGAVAIFDG